MCSLAMTEGGKMYNQLQLREIFHLEFLRWFSRKIKPQSYALKGGSNLRFFYNSIRYSGDMDLGIKGVDVDMLKDVVMKVLRHNSFQATLKPFGIERVVPPDILKAKQTETTQRFKAHLMTSTGEDLFTKIEFSRRGLRGKSAVEPVSDIILRSYKMAPVLVPHYDIQSTIIQKITALSDRSAVQARDIFDLYILSSQCKAFKAEGLIGAAKLSKAHENIFEVSFGQFRDTVVSYLSQEDQAMHATRPLWDEIKLKAVNFIEELRG